MPDEKAAIAIVIGAVVAIVLVNVGIFRQILSGKDNSWSRLIHTARDPWKKENDDFSELSRLVSGLKEKTPPEEKKNEQAGGH